MRTTANSRRRRERRTIETMIALFCRDEHGAGTSLCPQCEALAAYAGQRLEKCPFADDKPTCAQCTVHCYKPSRRGEIQAVMRYAGPRLLFRRPLLVIRHMLAERKGTPAGPHPQSRKRPDNGKAS
jgi:hypothetical protein